MRIVSFSYRYGGAPIRTGNDLVLDCRGLRNPYGGAHSGLDADVQRRVFSSPLAESLVAQGVQWLMADPDHRVLVGCSYGRHRSVAIAERIASITGLKAYHTSRRMRGEH